MVATGSPRRAGRSRRSNGNDPAPLAGCRVVSPCACRVPNLDLYGIPDVPRGLRRAPRGVPPEGTPLGRVPVQLGRTKPSASVADVDAAWGECEGAGAQLDSEATPREVGRAVRLLDGTANRRPWRTGCAAGQGFVPRPLAVEVRQAPLTTLTRVRRARLSEARPWRRKVPKASRCSDSSAATRRTRTQSMLPFARQ